jgi:hypothetical protein
LGDLKALNAISRDHHVVSFFGQSTPEQFSHSLFIFDD